MQLEVECAFVSDPLRATAQAAAAAQTQSTAQTGAAGLPSSQAQPSNISLAVTELRVRLIRRMDHAIPVGDLW